MLRSQVLRTGVCGLRTSGTGLASEFLRPRDPYKLCASSAITSSGLPRSEQRPNAITSMWCAPTLHPPSGASMLRSDGRPLGPSSAERERLKGREKDDSGLCGAD